MTTDLDRMILAARQIGEVVGEDILARLVVERDGVWLCAPDDPTEPGWGLDDADALDLLTARVWRAVRGWARSVGGMCEWDDDGSVYMQVTRLDIGETNPDLPSAVAAIHKHWQEAKPTGSA